MSEVIPGDECSAIRKAVVAPKGIRVYPIPPIHDFRPVLTYSEEGSYDLFCRWCGASIDWDGVERASRG